MYNICVLASDSTQISLAAYLSTLRWLIEHRYLALWNHCSLCDHESLDSHYGSALYDSRDKLLEIYPQARRAQYRESTF